MLVVTLAELLQEKSDTGFEIVSFLNSRDSAWVSCPWFCAPRASMISLPHYACASVPVVATAAADGESVQKRLLNGRRQVSRGAGVCV